MATYEGLTSAQWANRIMEFNPGKFDKSGLVKHYTAQQIQLMKGLKGAAAPKTPKKSSYEDAVKYVKTIKKAPNAPAHSGKALEIEKLLRKIASENGLTINFDTCPRGV